MRNLLAPILSIYSMLMTCFICHGQFASQQSMIAFQPLHINPAFVGSFDALQVQMQHRKMWIGIAGAPTQSNLSLGVPIVNKQLYGSLSIHTDRIGLLRTNTIMAGGAYKIKLQKNSTLRFGLSFGMDQIVYQGNQAIVSNKEDISLNDAVTRSGTFQLGTGVNFQLNNLYAGLAVPRLLTPAYAGGGRYRTTHDFANYNYHLTLGNRWHINNSWKLNTGIYSKKIAKLEQQTEIYALAESTIFSTGLSYRHKDAVLFLLQWKVNEQLSVHYAYDHPSSSLRTTTQGSHEWLIGYVFSYNNKTASPKTF
jgi:type IX secretion system PorP/SprF family membrane protein